jgi:hypothetical protein
MGLARQAINILDFARSIMIHSARRMETSMKKNPWSMKQYSLIKWHMMRTRTMTTRALTYLGRISEMKVLWAPVTSIRVIKGTLATWLQS